MKGRPSLGETVGELQLTVEELKKALREAVFETRRKNSAIFGPPRQSRRWPQVFVLMPFSTKLKPVYKDHIRKAIKKVKLRVARADDFFSARAVMSDIWSAIHAASFVVADCTERNPNVMYEIGLAHAIGRETIIISQSIDDIPFDLRHLRFILYEFTPRGMKKFEADLVKAIAEGRVVRPPRRARSTRSATA